MTPAEQRAAAESLIREMAAGIETMSIREHLAEQDQPYDKQDVAAIRQLIDNALVVVARPDEPHQVDIRPDGWTLQHPLYCQASGTLFTCPTNQAAITLTVAPAAPGRYSCYADEAGRLVLVGGPIGDTDA